MEQIDYRITPIPRVLYIVSFYSPILDPLSFSPSFNCTFTNVVLYILAEYLFDLHNFDDAQSIMVEPFLM